MLKIIVKIITILNSIKKYNNKDALLIELLKENKKLKLELKRQNTFFVTELRKANVELYDERLYSRFKEKEYKDKIAKQVQKGNECKNLIKIQTYNFTEIYT